MSTPQVNAPTSPSAPAPAPGSAPAEHAGGKFQGKSAEVVASRDNGPAADGAPAAHAAWKRGEAKPDPNTDRVMTMMLEAAKQEQAQLRQASAGRQPSRSLIRSLVNMLLRLFRRSPARPPAQPAAPTAGNPADPGKQLQDATNRALLKDPKSGMVYQQIDALRTSISAAPEVRNMLQQASRDELSYEFGVEARKFRRLTTAATSAKFIAATPNAGQGAIESAHQETSPARQKKMADRIDLGVRIIDRLSSTRYVPEQEELRQAVPSATFRSFGDTGTNPYSQLVQNPAFGEAEEKHLRTALIGASELLEQAGQLVVDSALAKESEVVPEELIEMARQFGIDEQLEPPPIYSTPL